MKTQKINHLAVWILVLIHQVIGAIWYSPFLFANPWMDAMGKSMSDLENVTPVPYIVSIVSAIVMCYVMAWLFKKLEVSNLFIGLTYAFIFWFGFEFFEIMTFNAFGQLPFALTFINTGKSLVTFLISGAVLGSWKKYSQTPEAKTAV